MQYELSLDPPQESFSPVSAGTAIRRYRMPSGRRYLHAMPAGALHALLGSLLRQWSHRPARWITWIAPRCVPTPTACRRFHLPPERHRLVFPRRGVSLQRILEHALSTATSHVVLAWRTPGESLQEEVLEFLARQGDCHLYLFDAPDRR